jgi:hypothetical protein
MQGGDRRKRGKAKNEEKLQMRTSLKQRTGLWPATELYVPYIKIYFIYK